MHCQGAALPPEMESTRRRLARRHTTRVLALAALFLGLLITWVAVARPHQHENDPFPRWLIEYTPLFLAGPAMICAIVLIDRRDRTLSRECGFICRHCGEPLYSASSILLADALRTGRCAKCQRRLFPTPPPEPAGRLASSP